MNLEIFILNGYSYFILPAFIFTFICCFFLYLKIKKNLIKQEKVFSSYFKQQRVLEINITSKENTKKILSRAKAF